MSRSSNFSKTLQFPVAETLQERAFGEEYLLCALENFQEWQVTRKVESLVERPSKNSLAAESAQQRALP